MDYTIKDIMKEAVQRKEIRDNLQLVINRLNDEAKSYIDSGYNILIDFDSDNPDCIKAYFPFIYSFCAAPDDDYDVCTENEHGDNTSGFTHFFGKNNEISTRIFSFYVEVKFDEIVSAIKEEKKHLNETTLYSKLCELISNAL